MLVQIYEISSPEEARAVDELGADHIGVLVGDGSFPREQPIDRARLIFSAISTAKGVALSLSADIGLIGHIVAELKPAILHLGAASDLLTPAAVRQLKKRFAALTLMRSIPVVDASSVAAAQSYDGVADMLLLDSYRPGHRQIGALGVTHSWDIDRTIVESVGIPVIVAGGLGPDNVVEAIASVGPAGVDSKTRTDKNDGSHSKDLQKVKQFVDRAKSLR